MREDRRNEATALRLMRTAFGANKNEFRRALDSMMPLGEGDDELIANPQPKRPRRKPPSP